MSAGRLRERVRLERRTTAPDGYGNTTAAWAEIVTVWGEIKPLRHGETVLAARLQGTGVVEILIRWSTDVADLSADDRAVDARAGTVYNIRAVENRDMRKRFLTLTAERGVAS